MLRRRRKLALVIEGLESRIVLSSATTSLSINPQVITRSLVSQNTHNITVHTMDTGGTHSSQPSPASDGVQR